MSGSPMVQRAIGSFWNSTPVSRSSISIPHTVRDRKSTRLNSSHSQISYAVFCLKKKKRHLFTSLTAYFTRHDPNDVLLLSFTCMPRGHDSSAYPQYTRDNC